MDLDHLNLRVVDIRAVQAFYERWFGFREKAWHDDGAFLVNDDGFLLALMPAPGPVAMPAGVHIGFQQPDGEAVATFRDEMAAAGVPTGPALEGEDGYVTFRCWDPSGLEIEVFWER
jgi:catechol 2,3-dioxygenase-like lactoylglutathione lyase family enzyme